MTRRVLVTRPIEQAQGWVERLRAAGFDAEALPLIGIEPVADARPVVAAWQALGGQASLMFVSANAVAQFFAAKPAGSGWPPGVRAAAPGPGTAAALRAAGVPAAAIVEPAADAAQFDSESLWAVLSRQGPWRGRSVLVVRGASDSAGEAHSPDGQGREWLAERWREAGAEVASLAVYRRSAPVFDAAQARCWDGALDAPAQHLWLFGSSEAIGHGEAIARRAGRSDDWHRSAALATHPRIAERARACGFVEVFEAPPTFGAVLQALRDHEASQGRR
ncbi:MAG TPA: uroporphyrinogen-III synthase [Methylibium sp.]|uniref:uroporphyrinogen-III synthase n=1 Tax=Methylibium sp. TaxID=2067992 RepID=UPI002DBFD87E|nr:uroporphyrinogen-III synthase [Methylibium sp.]HEU4458571.1 uroporphyrinogen-III synthase [Methylibium sp.]